MFADACRKASEFTRPLLTSIRLQNGEVRTDCSSFIVLNDEGWVISAGHPFDSFVKYQADQNKIKEINELNAKREQQPDMPGCTVKLDPKFIRNHSFWWGWDGVRLNHVYVNRQIDIAVGKIEPFNPDWVREYPVLIDPDHAQQGTSLVRVGYAFLEVQAAFNEQKDAFMIPKIPSKDLLFPNEGIHTRTINRGKSKDGDYDIVYTETSTPGLRGQSGGPIMDREGRLYAMQVQTSHNPMGFHPSVDYEGQRMVENQFMNLGLGVSVKTIREILDKRGIRYKAEGDEEGYRIIG